MTIDIKMKKKSVAELGHNGRLNVYVDPKKLPWPWHLSPFLQNGWVYLAKLFFRY